MYQKTFIVGSKTDSMLYRYDNILDYELLEDGETITKGGLGRAVAGGVLFGGLGAIVGGSTGKRKTKSICDSLRIKITLRNAIKQVEYLDFISASTKKDSTIYKAAYNNAQEALSCLAIACDAVKQVEVNTQEAAPYSVADEILKFKNLLDQGIITEEEFKKKKSELLGM